MTAERAVRSRWAPWLAFLLPVLLHLHAVRGTFLLDDVPLVLDSPAVKELQLGNVLGRGTWDNATEVPGLDGARMAIYRPLATLSLAVSYQIYGERAAWFRLENVLLHALVSWLVLLLLRRCGLPERGAVFGALAFGVLPVHVEAICGIVLRNELLAAALGLAALLGHLAGRPVLAALALLGSLFAKESAIALPFVALALERVFRRERAFDLASLARRHGPSLVAVGVYLGVRGAVLGRLTVADGPVYFADESTLEVWLTMARFATEEYLGALTLGWPLVFDYSRDSFPSTHTGDPVAWVLLTAWCAVGIASAVGTFRGRSPWAGAAFSFLVLLGPTSNLVTRIGVIGATRLVYLPSLGFALALGLLFGNLRSARLAIILGAVLLAGYGARSAWKVTAWDDPTALYEDILSAAPRNALANLSLGNEHLRPVLAGTVDGAAARTRADAAFERLRTGLLVLPVEWARYHRALAVAALEADREADLLVALVALTWPTGPPRDDELERAIDALPLPRPGDPFHLDHHLRQGLLAALVPYVAIERALERLEAQPSDAPGRAERIRAIEARVTRFRAAVDGLAARSVPGLAEHARPVFRRLLERFQNDLGVRYARLR